MHKHTHTHTHTHIHTRKHMYINIYIHNLAKACTRICFKVFVAFGDIAIAVVVNVK